jgi:TPR repeat protein
MRTFWLAAALGLFSLGVCSGQFDRARANELLNAARDGDAEAKGALRALAEQGDAVAQNGMALVETPEGPLYWHRLSARQGFRTAQFNLGGCYLRGCGGESDIENGVRWLTIAAYQGEWLAQGTLGDLYRGQQGVPRDDVESYKWYAVAAATVLADGRPEIQPTLLQRIAHVAPRMTPAQISKAQELAAAWKPKPWSELQADLPE